MRGDRGLDDANGDFPPNLSSWQRRVLARSHRKQAKGLLGDRLRQTFLRPVDPESPGSASVPEASLSAEELEVADRTANDKERLIGLIAAPIAAALGILVISALISDDPPAHLKSGAVNRLHVNVSTYHSLTVVLLALSVVMLVAAMLRKRLFIGIAMALYGLAIFNLHFWGFGIPFIMCAAWYLVRSYRIHREWRVATGDLPSYSGRTRTGGPRPNKRYTPPTSSPGRVRPANTKRAG